MDILSRVKEKKPLVHHITNYVTVNDCANITLCAGGLPVMAHSEDEVEDMVKISNALVLNMGTPDSFQVSSMIKAGRMANNLGIPVVFDPVGVGATPYRTGIARKILEQVKVAVIKGNKGEISVLAGAGGEVRGVESVGEYSGIDRAARELARCYDGVVIVTGAEDIVTDGERLVRVKNGHPMMGRVVGTGCMGASVVGVFVGACEEYLAAAVEAMVFYGVAGELAARKQDGPAAYKTNFLDAIASLDSDTLHKIRRVE